MTNEEPELIDLGNIGRELVLSSTGASEINDIQRVQTLWSSYGDILRVTLDYHQSTIAEPPESVVVKFIHPPARPEHPRGWHSDASAARKLNSYRVEVCWYENYANHCQSLCPMPGYLASQTDADNTWLVLQDLNRSHPVRHSSLNADDCIPCLQWLARFHASHLGSTGEGLWPTGSYWHLQTRKDELNAMAAGKLKDAAISLDRKLANCKHKTLIHGDAKVGNVCFSATGADIAMVDFQYVGCGCGMRDVVYFLGSCLSSIECGKNAGNLLNDYFYELNRHLPKSMQSCVEEEWRALYATAWADFHRFLAGWMPGHQKINSYMRSMTQIALNEL